MNEVATNAIYMNNRHICVHAAKLNIYGLLFKRYGIIMVP
jgi:hypothetical protein